MTKAFVEFSQALFTVQTTYPMGQPLDFGPWTRGSGHQDINKLNRVPIGQIVFGMINIRLITQHFLYLDSFL